MIDIQDDALCFSFPHVHIDARLRLAFIRTTRLDEDEILHAGPPALGRFPLFHVDDHASRVPASWVRHGGVMFPIHRSEAMWLSLDAGYCVEHGAYYPFAVKIAAGKRNVLTGEPWDEGITDARQDHLVAPLQNRVDGFLNAQGQTRQFVAAALGKGATEEEQITGQALYGGLQVAVYPMKPEAFHKHHGLIPPAREKKARIREQEAVFGHDMGARPGSGISQNIFADPYSAKDWALEHKTRCFVHMADALSWPGITGESMPASPLLTDTDKPGTLKNLKKT